MTKIPPSISKAISSILFREDFDALIMAYDVGVEAMDRRGNDFEAGIRKQLSLRPNDPFPAPDPNDPDDPLELLYEHTAEIGGKLSGSKHILRKTFTIALSHLWERYRYPIVPPENINAAHLNSLLANLKLAANCAKHSSGDSAEKLLKVRPDLFPRLVAPMAPSERFLVISESTFEEFVSAITALVHNHRI